MKRNSICLEFEEEFNQTKQPDKPTETAPPPPPLQHLHLPPPKPLSPRKQQNSYLSPQYLAPPPNQSPQQQQQYPHLLIDPNALDSIPIEQLVTTQTINQSAPNPNPTTPAGRKNIKPNEGTKQQQKKEKRKR